MLNRVYIFGFGDIGKNIISNHGDKYNILGFLDNDQRLWGRRLENGLVVYPPEKIKEGNFDFILVASKGGFKEIPEQLAAMGIGKDRIIMDYALEAVMLRRIRIGIVLIISTIRLIPHWVVYNIHKQKDVITHDIKRWLKCYGLEAGRGGVLLGFLYIMTFYKEYRNLYYYRIGFPKCILRYLCMPMNTLYIYAKDIGPGLFIQHGFSTIIAAKAIGKDCWINQQVTIGYSNATDCPIIGDNVIINAGAKVIGKAFIGNNSIIGANAVVVKNVPENCTVVGVPAYIVRRNGIKTREEL